MHLLSTCTQTGHFLCYSRNTLDQRLQARVSQRGRSFGWQNSTPNSFIKWSLSEEAIEDKVAFKGCKDGLHGPMGEKSLFFFSSLNGLTGSGFNRSMPYDPVPYRYCLCSRAGKNALLMQIWCCTYSYYLLSVKSRYAYYEKFPIKYTKIHCFCEKSIEIKTRIYV